MRLIDADKLKRKVQRIATEAWKMKLTASIETTLNQFIDYVDKAPSINIVRCGECKYWHKNIKENDGIPIADMCYDFQADDFCSYGEREGE